MSFLSDRERSIGALEKGLYVTKFSAGKKKPEKKLLAVRRETMMLVWARVITTTGGGMTNNGGGGGGASSSSSATSGQQGRNAYEGTISRSLCSAAPCRIQDRIPSSSESVIKIEPGFLVGNALGCFPEHCPLSSLSLYIYPFRESSSCSDIPTGKVDYRAVLLLL